MPSTEHHQPRNEEDKRLKEHQEAVVYADIDVAALAMRKWEKKALVESDAYVKSSCNQVSQTVVV